MTFSLFSLNFEKKVDLLDISKTIHFDNKQLTILYPCNSNSICTPIQLILPKGEYQFEVWGANGGDTKLNIGGIGGYSSGRISLLMPTRVYLTIGGKGSHSEDYMKPEKGGYNGGGNGWFYNENAHGAGGGGATDIRIKQNTLFHRVIVAGGGGGAGGKGYSNIDFPGGSGGGEEGIDGVYNPEDGGNTYYCVVTGANQTNPGYTVWIRGDYNSSFSFSYYRNASFGSGGSFLKTDETPWGSAGGGGGWFGGANGCVKGASGAGGSGFVFSEQSIKLERFGLGKEYYMTETKTETGKAESIPSPIWNQDIATNGNGAARITFLNVSFNTMQLFMTCKTSKSLSKGYIIMSIIIISNS